MSHWVPFYSTCPIANCHDPSRVIHWSHGDDNNFEDINEEGYVKCRKNGCSMNRNPCFILELLFKCRNHDTYQRIESTLQVYHALCMVSSNHLGLSTSEIKYLLNKISNHL